MVLPNNSRAIQNVSATTAMPAIVEIVASVRCVQSKHTSDVTPIHDQRSGCGKSHIRGSARYIRTICG